MAQSKVEFPATELKSLAIIGTAMSRAEAPFHDKSVTIWGVNGTLQVDDVKRLDVVFELHPKRFWGIPEVTDRLANFKGPVVMQEHYEEIPKSVKYPREAVRERFYIDCMGANLYVTNTITWMMLKGLIEGYTDIQLYGVHMEHETEYAYQQPNVAWAAGMIQGLGLTGLPYRISVAGESTLLKARYEYGFDEPSALMRAISERGNALKKGVDEAKGRMTEAREDMLRTDGAVQENEHWLKYVSGQK